MTRQKRKKSKRLSRHHILPSSRGGSDNSVNLANVNNAAHQNYHTLFSNMTPDEIIKYLVEYFWNDQWKWISIALNEKEENDFKRKNY